MTEHASLASPPTKPLIDPKEIREIAHDAVLKEVENEITRIVHNETVNEKILQVLETNKKALDEIKEIVTKSNERDKKLFAPRLETLKALKTKLETAT